MSRNEGKNQSIWKKMWVRILTALGIGTIGATALLSGGNGSNEKEINDNKAGVEREFEEANDNEKIEIPLDVTKAVEDMVTQNVKADEDLEKNIAYAIEQVDNLDTRLPIIKTLYKEMYKNIEGKELEDQIRVRPANQAGEEFVVTLNNGEKAIILHGDRPYETQAWLDENGIEYEKKVAVERNGYVINIVDKYDDKKEYTVDGFMSVQNENREKETYSIISFDKLEEIQNEERESINGTAENMPGTLWSYGVDGYLNEGFSEKLKDFIEENNLQEEFNRVIEEQKNKTKEAKNEIDNSREDFLASISVDLDDNYTTTEPDEQTHNLEKNMSDEERG